MKTRADYVLYEKKKVNRGVKRERGKNTKQYKARAEMGQARLLKLH